jgi:hypothetical protein
LRESINYCEIPFDHLKNSEKETSNKTRNSAAPNIVLAKAGVNTLSIQILSYARLRQYFSVGGNYRPTL